MLAARIPAKLVGGLTMAGGTIAAAEGAGVGADDGAEAGAMGGADDEAAAEEPLDNAGALRLDDKPLATALAKDTRLSTGPVRVEMLLDDAGGIAVGGATEALA